MFFKFICIVLKLQKSDIIGNCREIQIEKVGLKMIQLIQKV